MIFAKKCFKDKIKEMLIPACDVIPDEEQKAFCKKFMKEHLQEVIEILLNDPEFAPAKICASTKSCP